MNIGPEAQPAPPRTNQLSSGIKFRPQVEKNTYLENVEARTVPGPCYNKISFVETCRAPSDFLDNDPKNHAEIEMYGQKVINLSKKDLTNAEKSLLCKGLKFCPTQKSTDAGEVKKELDEFHDKLRTKQFFTKLDSKRENDTQTLTALQKISPYGNVTSFLKLRQKSKWKPPSGSPNLETFANMNDMTLGKSYFPRIKKQNITNAEREALKSLSKNPNITIKPADKGGSIVVMDTADYVTEAQRQLTDESTYIQLAHTPTEKFNQEVEQYLENMVKTGDITESVKKLLVSSKPKTPHIYFLPKIHKQKLPPPGRPIVSTNNCPTEKISAFVDHFLSPLVKEQKSYVQDTTDFINKVEGQILSEESIIGTLDVTSLYTNIPNKEGISCIKEILDKTRNRLERPLNSSLVDLLEMVLTKNNFQFNGTQYLQIGGTAMGTRVAPTYANLFMSNLEEKLISEHELKPKLWLRYIDDILFIWEHGEDELNKWLNHLNKSHTSIKFTIEHSKTEINFLDTTVKKGPNSKIYVDLYVKKTDTNSYLKYDSAHPPKCKESLPYSQFLRIKRICTNEEDYNEHIATKEKEFLDKGYPKTTLEEAKLKLTTKDRAELLIKNPKEKNEKTERVFLTATYREGYQYVPKKVKKNWDILARSSTTKNLHRADLMIGYRKPRDIKSYLVKARTDYKLKPINSTH